MATYNHNENFTRLNGAVKTIKVLMTASIAAEQWAALYPDPWNAWQFTIADWTTWNFVWIIQQTIATTDSDFASTKMVTVEIPTQNWTEYRFRVWAWTFTAADVWKKVDFHTDGASLAVDTTSTPVAIITGVISSTEWRCIFLGNWLSALPATT